MAENVKDKDGNDIEIGIDENGKPVARPIDYKQRYEELNRAWNKARIILNQSNEGGGPWAKRAAAALKILGLPTGRPVRIPKGILFEEYRTRLAALGREPTKDDKDEIYEDLKKHFDSASAYSIRQQLKAPTAAHKKAQRMIFGKNR